MQRRYLRTSEVAAAVGVHPNTVRMYEVWGLLQQIPRTPSGYRQFTQAHVDQMRLARMAFQGQWPGRPIHQTAVSVVKQAASGDLGGALESAYGLLAVIQGEQAEAEGAVLFLQRWAGGKAADGTAKPLRIGRAAALLGVTADVLRNWERDGLVHVPRDPHNRYRCYGAAEIGRLRVIRMLRRVGYSTMAILRMLLALDRGQAEDLRAALDTPHPNEDAYSAADRWLSALSEWEQRAHDIIALLEGMIAASS
ncbi:MAG: MerR family transcriptional regulator [Anaerolineae bacterium]|jgi:DNA-binding transcriptional MerR regulator|nr:MerR family transcriptional regulator [Anaerolineae bacterium]